MDGWMDGWIDGWMEQPSHSPKHSEIMQIMLSPLWVPFGACGLENKAVVAII